MLLNSISEKFTEETLDKILQNNKGDKTFKHTSWKFGSGFKKGDSYLSEVFRLLINGIAENGEETHMSVVIKSIPKNKGRRETFRSTDFFRNEIAMYSKILTYFEEFQNRKCIQDPFMEYPKLLFYHSDGINDFIVMEDLNVDGYKTASRKNGMNLAECELAVKTIGRFHAVSFAIKDQEPDIFQELCQSIEESLFSEQHRSWYTPFANDLINVVQDAAAKECGGTHYEDKIIRFTDAEFYSRMCKLAEPRSPYAVISHGDCWAPNFLLSDQTTPLRAKLVDFQLARVSSPILDLSFFIYSCTSQELRRDYYEHLLKVYYDACADLMKQLGSDPDAVFPIKDLYSELISYGRFGCGMALDSVTFSVMDDDVTPDLSTIEGEFPIPVNQILVAKPIKDPVGRRRLVDVFKHAIDCGYLEDFN